MRKTTRFATLLLISITLSTGLTGCGDPALNSLKENEPSEVYDDHYWYLQSQANTPVWQQALQYCDGKTSDDWPNCQVVLMTQKFKTWTAAANAQVAADRAAEQHPKPGQAHTGYGPHDVPHF